MRAKMALALGLAGVLIGMPGAWAKDPHVLPDTPEKIAEFLLKRELVTNFVVPGHPTFNIANRDIPDVIDGILAKRFSCLRSNATGNRDRGWSLYTDILLLNFGHGGPSRYFELNGRYVIGFDCRYQSCWEKGLMIFDKKQNEFVFAINHYIEWQPAKRIWAGNDEIGMISVFVQPGYPPGELAGLTDIVNEWGKAAHAGSAPPIQFYAVDCTAGSGSAGRQ